MHACMYVCMYVLLLLIVLVAVLVIVVVEVHAGHRSIVIIYYACKLLRYSHTIWHTCRS